ncbi:O-antigen ligase domain-containing protein [Lactiplantibacillus garii]|uniref:O-antigen ligase domain-containing protein n=1 Tax=Lactiplantibacillus garii TaxID=2306423 RepID=A0A426D8W3_9LACO|nr:O-antigen ligase family protein [Lactiplantibacillus garii]RRK11006.1 O-antigen ligase domain-containing protein [Lactiplantibacillus garii]
MHNRDLSAPRLLSGLKLLAILPPVGIAWLIYLSRWQWLHLIKRPAAAGRDPLLAFILLLMGVTGLNLNHHDYRSVWLSLLMLFVLLNLWLLCRQTTQMISLHALRKFMIQFGLYITISGNLFHWLNQWLTLPTWLKFMLGDLLWGYAANQNRLFGSAYNPNDACCLLLIALGLLLTQLTVHHVQGTPLNQAAALRSGSCVAILCLGIYQTKSRTGLAIMIVILIITAYQLLQRHRIWLSGVLASGLWLTWAFFPRSHSFAASLQTRLTIWHNSFDLFKQAPLLGVTYFGFAKRYLNLTGTYVPHAHDILLMLLASFGILGGIGFLALVVNSGWTLTKYWRIYRQPNLRYFIMTLPIIFAYGLTDFVLSSLQVLIIILLLIAYWHRERQTSHQLATPQ